MTDVLAHQLIQPWINLKKLIVILAVYFGTCAIVDRDDGGGSLATIKHANFSKVSTSFESPYLHLFKPVSELVSNQNFTFTFGDEEEIIVILSDRIILFTEYILRSVQNGLHSLHNIVDDILVVALCNVKLSGVEQVLGNRVGLDR